MPRYKYSPERLAAAAAQARGVTEVMRLLGVRVSGGSHAHISRQVNACSARRKREAIRLASDGGWAISHGTVSNISAAGRSADRLGGTL